MGTLCSNRDGKINDQKINLRKVNVCIAVASMGKVCHSLTQEKNAVMVFSYLSSSRAACYTTVAILCLICYWNSLRCELVHDDIFAIVDNKDLRPETPLTTLFRNDFWGKPMQDNTSHKSYRPICVLSFRFNYFLHGLQPFGYHLVNMLLHVAVSMFFLYFCEADIFHGDVKRSVTAAALFAVHPIHTEAVTGVVGRADILACLLFLISLHLYQRARKEENKSIVLNNNNKDKIVTGRPKLFLLTSIVCGSLSMLCKETGITVFGVCICFELIIRKNFFKNFLLKRVKIVNSEDVSKMLKRIVVIISTVIFLLAFRIQILHGQLPAFNEEDNPASFSSSLLTRFLTYSYLCAFNAWLLLAPVVLSYDWQIGSIPLVESFIDARNISSLGESPNSTLMGLCLLIIPFIPASNIFFRVGFVVAERILYIPSTGYCILIANGLHMITQKASQVSSNKGKQQISHNGKANGRITPTINHKNQESLFVVLLEYFFITILIAMVVKTVMRNGVWRDRETLFKSGVETLPWNAKVHYNYANFLRDSNKTEDAIKHYKIAVKLYPKHASSHNNLAALLGESKDAEFHFKQTLIHNPYHFKAMYNLATIYRKQGEFQTAKLLLEQCLRISPDYSNAIQIYAETLYDVGEIKQSLDTFLQASLRSNDADFFNNYGVFLGKIGKHLDSVNAYRRSIELQPAHKIALVNLGRQLKLMGRYQEAEGFYRRALKIQRDGSTLYLLGILLYHAKRFKEAELTFSEALKRDPMNHEYMRNYATSLFEQGAKEDAIGFLQNQLNRSPDSLILINTLANFFMNSNRMKEAEKEIDSGLKVHPYDAELHFLRANLFRENGDMESALKSYKEVVKLNPKHFSALQNIGVIYHLKGFKIEAESFYKLALKLDPSNKILQDNIIKLRRTK
eukprot:gene20407-22420_t